MIGKGMRRLALVLLLSACGTRQEKAAADTSIECRIDGANGFERVCRIEAVDTADGRILTVRKPDGGFRRLRVTTDGAGIVAADGAELAEVRALVDGASEVSIGGESFRLPAAVRR
jgi:hypothetical protein